MTHFQIKIIAILTMLIDHIGMVFLSRHPDLMVLRYVGRMAFPLFVFLVAEACVHTKSMNKYMTRLFVFAVISQIPFALALSVSVGLQIPVLIRLNIFFTLFLGVLLVHLYRIALALDRLTGLLFFMLLFIFAFILADVLSMDYGGVGVMFIMLMYIVQASHSKNKRLYVVLLLVVFLTLQHPPINELQWSLFAGGLLSIAPVAFYNGQLGFSNRWVKWGFYLFYPLHLLVLAWVAGGAGVVFSM